MHEDKRLIVILNFEMRLLCMLATAFFEIWYRRVSEYREFEAWIKVYADD